MGLRTEHYHVYESDKGIEVISKSDLKRWVTIPYEEWRQIIDWYGLALLARVEQLETLLSEHHAVGVLDNRLIGDECPVCAQAKGKEP